MWSPQRHTATQPLKISEIYTCMETHTNTHIQGPSTEGKRIKKGAGGEGGRERSREERRGEDTVKAIREGRREGESRKGRKREADMRRRKRKEGERTMRREEAKGERSKKKAGKEME